LSIIGSDLSAWLGANHPISAYFSTRGGQAASLLPKGEKDRMRGFGRRVKFQPPNPLTQPSPRRGEGSAKPARRKETNHSAYDGRPSRVPSPQGGEGQDEGVRTPR